MFPFQRSCELSFQISDEGDQFEQTSNTFENQIVLDSNNTNFTVDINNQGRGRGRGSGGRGRSRGRGQRSLSSSSLATGSGGRTSNTNNNNNNDEEERRIMHREYERQRRLEMSNLYDSLRTILPPEYTQGKRSISDHVGEAINYITYLKKNVKVLEVKRDELRQSTIPTHELGESSSGGAGLTGSRCNVLIRESVVGLEIEISIANEDEDRFSLSTALQVVFDHGLEVVSCTSTSFNNRLIHNMQCQVGNTTYIDMYQLQQKLNELVSS